MARAQGFARGDLDAAFPLDDKFLALKGRVSAERYYEATGIYFHVAAASWREAERKPVSKVCPDAGEATADLVAVGLLDTDGCVTRRAFANTVGRAKRQRRAAADRQARNRDRKSRVTNGDDDVTDSDSVASRASPSVLIGTDSDLDGTGRKNARVTPRQVVHHWLSEHGAATPVGWVNTTLNELVKVYGSDRICALWDAAPSDVRTSKQYVQLAERSLAPTNDRNGAAPRGHTRTAEEVNDAFH